MPQNLTLATSPKARWVAMQLSYSCHLVDINLYRLT